ncbi:hypothetical protein AB0B50_12215 [Streptomyces sp. NPDC041068]|uniref:hypothetical protein n=1 Tax=Streptomyces sp. NPDC041068 TaxID=3155130 RepID=UPI0033ED51BF
MRLSRTVTALAVSVSLTAGAVAMTAAPAFAAASVSRTAEDRALMVEQGFDALYAAIDELATRSADGTADETHSAAVDAAMDRVLSAVGAVRAADPEPKPKGDDPVVAAEAKLKAEVDGLMKAALSADLGKLVPALTSVPNLAVDLLIKVGLGKLAEGLPKLPKLPEAPKVPGLPEAPAVPAIPGLPQAPAVPAIPGLPKIPGLPF